MDAQARREWMRKWIAIGRREGWSSKEIAQRARVDARTVRRWNARFRAESVSLTDPDFEEQAFAEVVERAETNASRVEVVIPGKCRVIIDGNTIVQALARFLTAVDEC